MGQRGYSEQRTTSKTVIKTIRWPLTCVKIKVSQVLQLEIVGSWLRTSIRQLRLSPTRKAIHQQNYQTYSGIQTKLRNTAISAEKQRFLFSAYERMRQ